MSVYLVAGGAAAGREMVDRHALGVGAALGKPGAGVAAGPALALLRIAVQCVARRTNQNMCILLR